MRKVKYNFVKFRLNNDLKICLKIWISGIKSEAEFMDDNKTLTGLNSVASISIHDSHLFGGIYIVIHIYLGTSSAIHDCLGASIAIHIYSVIFTSIRCQLLYFTYFHFHNYSLASIVIHIYLIYSQSSLLVFPSIHIL